MKYTVKGFKVAMSGQGIEMECSTESNEFEMTANEAVQVMGSIKELAMVFFYAGQGKKVEEPAKDKE